METTPNPSNFDLEIERELKLLQFLLEQTFKMIDEKEEIKANPSFSYSHIKQLVNRVYTNEIDYLLRNPEEYYDFYLNQETN